MCLSAHEITCLVSVVIIYSVLIFQKPCLHYSVVEGNHPVLGCACLLATVMQRGGKKKSDISNHKYALAF